MPDKFNQSCLPPPNLPPTYGSGTPAPTESPTPPPVKVSEEPPFMSPVALIAPSDGPHPPALQS